MCDLWVEMQGEDYTIEWYEDVEGHRSGRDEKGRPGWQQLLTQLDRPDVAGVIADSFDRMYRNVHQFLNFLNRMEELNKQLITVKEGLDTTSTLGRAIVTILMVIYQLESDQTSDRMAANIKYKREQLGRHWGPLPFGADRGPDGHLIPTTKTYWFNPISGNALPNPEVDGRDPAPPAPGYELRRFIDALTAVYRAYSAENVSYDTVAAAVNEAGWRYYRDANAIPRPFNKEDIRRLVSFWQLYRGDLPIGSLTKIQNPTVLEGGHAPILPVDLCNRVGLVKQKRTKAYGYRTGESTRLYLLSDVTYCAVCGQTLNGNTAYNRRLYRHRRAKKSCPEKWTPADDLEAQILEILVKLGNTELLTIIAAEAEQLAREAFAQNNNAQPLLDQLGQQKARLTRLEDIYLDAAIDKERYLARKVEIDQAIIQLEDQLYAATQTLNFNKILNRMTSTLQKIPQASPQTKKALINSMIERLEVAGEQIVSITPRPWAQPFF